MGVTFSVVECAIQSDLNTSSLISILPHTWLRKKHFLILLIHSYYFMVTPAFFFFWFGLATHESFTCFISLEVVKDSLIKLF